LGTAANQIGPNALVLATHMNKVLGVPYGKIVHFFAVAFGLKVGRATLVRAVVRIGHRAECLYREIIVIVRESGVVYGDETGWRIGGQKAWLWALVALAATAYRIARSRGFDVPAGILGADYDGLLGRDGWAPYDHFLRALHQQCLQHFDRRAKNLEEVATRGGVRFPRAVQALVAAAFAVRDRRDEGAYTPRGLAIAIGRLKDQLQELLHWRLTHVQNRKLQKHMAKYQDQLFTFLEHPQIEGTNWPGEHAMRPAVLLRKISAGNRSDPGAHAHEVLLSIFRTASQRGIDPLLLLRCLLLRQRDDPLPSFLGRTG
jgi:transposase